MAKFIALSGSMGQHKRSGKGTFAERLAFRFEAEKQRPCQIVAFADPMRVFLADMYGWPKDLLFTDDKDNETVPLTWEELSPSLTCQFPDKTGELTKRELLQVFGTNVIRWCWDKDMWANHPFLKYNHFRGIVLISDLRFQNEAEACHRFGGINIKIVRDTGLTDDHPSENQEISEDLFDYVIHAKQGVDEYKRQIDQFIRENKDRLLCM